MSSEVDLVIPFRAFPNHSLSKRQTRDLARKAEKEYGRLIDTLTYSGLRAVGRRGESLGHILVFVSCPESLLNTLRKREGLPPPLAPADRLRLVYKFVTAPPADGGLGIVPTPGEWDLVEDAMLLHDKEFNDNWIRTWTRKTTTEGQLARIRDMFGDSTALYFAFLRAYTTSLALPAALGGIFYFLEKPYHPAYAFCLLIYSTLFTEYWRVAERVFTARFSPPESFPQSASKNGPASALTRDKALRQSTSGITWWRRDLRVLASFPIIALCAAALVILITSIFVYEAFITQLYTGPGRKIVAFTPTIMFVLLIPRFLAVYRKLATSLTSWENHSVRRSSASIDSVNTYENALATSRAKQAHAASLTLKTFVLTSLVSYLGLFLSAFVYVPFGEEVMHAVQVWIAGVDVRNSRFGSVVEKLRSLGLNDTLAGTFGSPSSKLHAAGKATSSIWETDIMGARQKLNPSRLTDQMFACIVTNQLSQNFNEIGLPFILRFIEKKPWKKTAAPSAPALSSSASISSSASSSGSTVVGSVGSPSKKHVSFEDEKMPADVTPEEAEWEAKLLEQARYEVKLPPYDVFEDYNEMVVQFGYVVVWSSIWGLAPVLAFLNNILEQRSDAFKITTHARRPIPQRTRTIGPWLDVLTILTWLGALVNAALVYMFGPGNLLDLSDQQPSFDPLVQIDVDGQPPEYISPSYTDSPPPYEYSQLQAKKSVLLMALLCALLSSHVYLLLRAVVRRVMERVMLGGKGVEEYSDVERMIDISVGAKEAEGDGDGKGQDVPERMFWKRDDGLDEIARILKEA